MDDVESNVVQFPGMTALTVEPDVEMPIPTANVLEGAVNADLKDVVICGRDKEGNFYLASSSNNLPNVLWLLELARFHLVANGPD